MTNLVENIKARLKEVANEESTSDDQGFDLYCACGGNFDDAYNIGCVDGEIILARELLKEFFDE